MAKQNTDIPVEEYHVGIVRDTIGKEWMELGRGLKISNATLDNISVDLVAHGSREMAYRVLTLWRRENADEATLTVLIDCLSKMRRQDIIRDLKNASSPKSGPSAPKETPTGAKACDCDPLASKPITVDHKRFVCMNMSGEKWRYLGEDLGLLPDRLNEIFDNSKSVSECCRRTLEVWMDSDDHYLGELISSLRKVECVSIANKIEAM